MLGLLMLWQSVEGPLLQLVEGPLEARPQRGVEDPVLLLI